MNAWDVVAILGVRLNHLLHPHNIPLSLRQLWEFISKYVSHITYVHTTSIHSA